MQINANDRPIAYLSRFPEFWTIRWLKKRFGANIASGASTPFLVLPSSLVKSLMISNPAIPALIDFPLCLLYVKC